MGPLERLERKNGICNNIYEARDLFAGPLTIMVGAGLSVPMPTGLPLLPEIVKSLMNLDWFDGDEKFPITNEYLINKIVLKIRLEHLLSLYHEWGKHDVGKLLTQFRDAEPNWYHYQIAKLVKENVIERIFTTNIDLCIEKALDAQHIPYNQIIDEKDLSNVKNSGIKIIKLHGTLYPPNSTQFAKGLIVTLESMAKDIDSWKAQYLHESIDKNGLVCLGYSGRDSFDINPILRKKSNQKILWVKHDPTENFEINYTLQFSKFREPIIIDTTTFLGETKKLDYNPRNFCFQQVCSKSELFHPSVFLGRILEAAQEYEAAIKYYENVFWSSTGSNYWMFEIINISRGLAVCNFEINNYEKALAHLNIAKGLLSHYRSSVEKEGRTLLKIEMQIFLDQELLLCEESFLLYGRLNKIDLLKKEEEKLFQLLDMYERSYEAKPNIRSRLLLNRASVRLGLLAKKESECQYDYNDIKRDLDKACSLKKECGDIIGNVMALNLLSGTKLILGEFDDALYTSIESFNMIRKLSSSIPSSTLEMVLGAICIAYFYKLNIGFSPANKIPSYDWMNDSTRTKYENRVKELLSEPLIKGLDKDGFFAILEGDNSVQEILSTVRKMHSNEKEVYWNEMAKIAKNSGVVIITPDRDIEQYRNGLEALKYIEDPATYAVTKASQWQAIGYQYKKAGDYLQAAASYQIALDSLKPAPTSFEFPEEQKKLWVKELEDELATVSDINLKP